jgi:Flp pilus assembly protein TadG
LVVSQRLNASTTKQGCEKMTSTLTKVAWQRGQSIIEISLITPLLLIALYIPADFGIAFYTGNLTQNAAREGARIGSGLSKTGNAPNLFFTSTHANTVKTAVFSRMPGYLTNKSVTVKFYDGAACMEFIEVTAQGDYSFFLYQLMRLFGSTIPNSVTISRTTQIPYTYQPYTNTAYCTVSATYGPYSS